MIMMIISDGEYDDEGAMVEVKVENRSVRTMGCPPNFNSLSFQTFYRECRNDKY